MGWIIPRGVAIATILTGLTFGLGAQAQELEMVEAVTDWSVYVDQDPKVCFIVSQPTKSVVISATKIILIFFSPVFKV